MVKIRRRDGTVVTLVPQGWQRTQLPHEEKKMPKTLDFDVPGSHRDDPFTSAEAFERFKPHAGTKRALVLSAYATGQHLTDEDVADQLGLTLANVQKRATELRQGGFIAKVYVDGELQTRVGAAGARRMLCKITAKGRSALREMGEQ